MRDVNEQLVAYAEILDRSAPPLEDLAAPRNVEAPRRMAPRALGTVVAAALAVLVVVGGFAVLSRRATTSVPPAVTTSNPSTIPVPAINLDLLNPQAVTPSMFPDWEHAFAGPGGVAVVDGIFHMLSAAYGDGVATVAHATSSDGVVWTQDSSQPVLDLSLAPWAPLEFDHAIPRSLIVDDAGNWQLFFEIAWLDRAEDEFRTSIGRVVAPEPAGPWSFDAQPILSRDDDLEWMSKRAFSPSVIVDDGEFVMLFVGASPDGGVVGRATSPDGRDWVVDPEPVLEANADWERGGIARVDLVAFDEGFVMVYAGDTTSRRGMAVSLDGSAWRAHPENPFMTTADLPRASVFDTEFVRNKDGLLALVENGGVRSEREVVVMQVEVDLPTLLAALHQ